MVIRHALLALAALACAIGPPALASPLVTAYSETNISTDHFAIGAFERAESAAALLNSSAGFDSIVLLPTGDEFDRPQNQDLIAGFGGAHTARHYDPG